MNCSTRAIHELSGFFCNFLSPCHETGGSCKDPPKSGILLGIFKTLKIFTWIVLSRNNKRNKALYFFFVSFAQQAILLAFLYRFQR